MLRLFDMSSFDMSSLTPPTPCPGEKKQHAHLQHYTKTADDVVGLGHYVELRAATSQARAPLPQTRVYNASTSVIAINLDTAWIILCIAFPYAPAPSPRCVPQSLVHDMSPVVYYYQVLLPALPELP
jgi:hypothetical protein